jgi:FG-GAP-like repeat
MYRKLIFVVVFTSVVSCSSDSKDYTGGGFTGGETNPVCTVGTSSGEVSEPQFLMNLDGETSWFASPIVYDLDGDGSKEIIAAYYRLFIFDSSGGQLDIGDEGNSRVYAPHVVADLDGDGITEIVVGRGHEVIVYEWINGALSLKAGWPASTASPNSEPEIRGMSAGDLDGNGTIEIAVTTTMTDDEEDGGSQVYVFEHDGSLYQPVAGHLPAWPRYNALAGGGNDADRNGAGHHGFGCYGLNIGIGNIDDDPDLELFATYDNHHIQAFKKDGVAIDVSPYFTNRSNDYSGERLTWGQFIRWADPEVEENHYHFHTGEWPHPDWTEWLQWTASPPNVVDMNNDGFNEVVGIPNIEKHVPYQTQAYGIMVLEGAHHAGENSGMRLPGWEVLPRGDKPISVDGWYPPGGVPAPLTINIQGDDRPEIVVSLNDGFMYCITADASILWRYNYRHNKRVMYSSEPVAVDLNQDGSPEIIFSTFGSPDAEDSGNLVILSSNGVLLYDIPLPNPGHNGNGNGAPAAPTVADLDGDGQLEIFIQTFEHGMDIFTVPGSSTNCLLWPTARGGNLRKGSPD